MASLFEALGLPDTDYQYINTIGQSVVYDATAQVLGDHNADLAAAMAVFVEKTTSDFKTLYKLPGSGELQRRGRQSAPGAVKAAGQWEVMFPLEDFGVQVAADDVTMAYMNLQEYNRHIMTVMKQDVNTRRKEMLRSLFNNVARSYTDEVRGALTVQPLANNDTVKYPPVMGSLDDATENMYLASGYIASAINDTNNPIPTMVNKLEGHFGTPTGGSNIVVFINNAQTSAFQNLSNFDTVPNRFVEYGANVSLVPLDKFPAGLPGRTIGETDSALIQEWRWIPANYMVAIHLDAPQPLLRRIDPPEVGLGDGLQMVAEDMSFPFRTALWRDRFGFGCGNRLNGVVMKLTSGSYDVPTLFNY